MTISFPWRLRWLFGLLLASAPLIAGCSMFPILSANPTDRPDKEVAAGTPGKYSLRVSQFVFMSDFELRRDLALFKDLEKLPDQVNRDLRLPQSNTIVFVYLFQDKDRYEKYMVAKHPELPKRRAFFVAQPRRQGTSEDLMIYTYWGDRIHQDLRHELTHAILHSVLKDVPLWLDEGLAEYFEVPRNWDGANPEHITKLRNAGVKFDLARLEKLKDVQHMETKEYREAWAWVHLMLKSSPQAKQVLLAYLQELRTNANPGPLQPRLATAFLSPESAVQTHLADLERAMHRPATPTAQR